ncbi:glutamate--tRNA ligase [Patescibacteria group bacterium]|nr:glutamate--tRNA ligase [Patescibacteria group bacterium]
MSIAIKNSRVRIAPSPTGFLHIGTARTALFNYLFAQNYKIRGDNASFILRIEDTDQERSKKEYEEDILNGLNWLGIEWDEGPTLHGTEKGNFGPYNQSKRERKLKSYSNYLTQLLKNGKAFACFCPSSKEEIEDKNNDKFHILCPYKDMAYNPDETRQFVIRYKNTYAEKLEERFKKGGDAFKTNEDDYVTFQDLVRNKISSPKDILGHFVIAKSFDEPLYNFAVVVDDYEMKITHVIRGEDHIPNTPKQLLLAEALGWAQVDETGVFQAPWTYAHLPLILGTDRSKLSKRHGATSVNEYKTLGYLPEAMVNFMALLGWNPGDEQEIFSKEELAKEFSLEKIQKSGAVFDTVKLDWMNGEYIRRKSVEELTALCIPFLEKAGLIKIQNAKIKSQHYNPKLKIDEYVNRILALEQPRLKKLSETGERVNFFFQEPEYDKELLRWKNMSDEDIKKALQKAEKLLSVINPPIDKKTLEKAFFDEIGDSDKGKLLWPLRAALSGKKASPGPFEIVEILGIEESIKRLEQAEQKFG